MPFPVKCLYYLLFVSGEVVTARAAAACKTIMVLIQRICHTYKRCCRLSYLLLQALSFTSSCTLEEVASSCNAVRFFQIYVLYSSWSLIISIFVVICSLCAIIIIFLAETHTEIWLPFTNRYTRGEIYQLCWCREQREMDTRLLSWLLILPELDERRQT